LKLGFDPREGERYCLKSIKGMGIPDKRKFIVIEKRALGFEMAVPTENSYICSFQPKTAIFVVSPPEGKLGLIWGPHKHQEWVGVL
jgi:hypothetical protein